MGAMVGNDICRRAGRWPGIAVLLLAAFLAAGTAYAADPPLPPASQPSGMPKVQPASDWRFQATFYGWLTALSGDVGVRDLPTTPVDASLSDVLDNLDGAVMGSFLATDGRWLFFADLVLAKLSDQGPVGRYGRNTLDVDLSQAIATGAIGYWLPLGTPDVDVAITGGLRYVRMSSDMSLAPADRPLVLSGHQSQSWVDPTVGLAVHWTIDERWFVNALADIGGFGVGSKLSSNGYAGLGYMWTPSISTAIGYRYLYEDYESAGAQGGSFRYNTTMHGPTFSLAWHF